MDTADVLVVFTPAGSRGRFPVGTPVLAAARALGVDIDSVCGGRAICGRCQVLVAEGEFLKHGVRSGASSLAPRSAAEQRYCEHHLLAVGHRLSCQALLVGDVVVDVPASSQVHRQVVRKAAEVRDIELHPAVRLRYVEVAGPDAIEPASDLRRLELALDREWNLRHLDCDLAVVQELPRVLRADAGKVTVAVHEESRIIAVWPGFHETVFGLAVDVGSTTIAAHLCDLATGEVVASAGRMNPQIRFGEDLMSRVSYAMLNPDGAAQMTAVVRAAVGELAAEVAAMVGGAPELIVEAVIVGNPIMHHLVLGIDPAALGVAPFTLTVDRALTVAASAIGVALHPGARVYVLPCIAGHLGADTAAMILAERPDLAEEMTLLVDVGTNAEIVLGNRERLVACSSPTGPAFEGAQISCGQRAAPGAIERVRIDRETLEPRFKVIGCDMWSDEAGFPDAVAATGVTGVCGSGIIEALAELYLSGVISREGVIDGALAAQTPRVVANGRTFSYVLHDGARTLAITQNDVRAIQLAKAALHAGIRLLMERLRADTVDRIRLAGAFGSHIDVKYAMVLGMLPDCDVGRVTSAGNAAGSGARVALIDSRSRATIEEIVRHVERVETATEPRFQTHFVEAMAFPHQTADYPHLGAVVDLPAPVPPVPARGNGRSRRPVAGRANE